MKNEESCSEMDLGAIYKSIWIKTLYFVSMSLHLFLFTPMIICVYGECSRVQRYAA